jgi:UDP:flavonoid glycosyltransferase YjiC (YdhE family)
MPRRDALRVVCYAVNGTGVGHVTRLLAIARWLRRYAAALDRKLEVWFLTSSEADGLVFREGFAAFKIPSKTIVHETGIDHRAYLALAKQWIWHTLGLLRPDLLIVDTFPRGSFGELLGALDLCRHKAFVYRPVRRGVAARPDFQAMLPLYDLILVPETASDALVPAAAVGRVVHVGPVVARERWELLPREVARARLGVPDGKRCVYVSAGGGGDRDAEAQIGRALRGLLADPSLSVVVGAGPLYRGEPFPGLTVIPGQSADWSLAFDAAVCAAGYNTFAELMFAGVPTVFALQEKLADDQAARATLAVSRGAGALLPPDADAGQVRAAVQALLERADARGAARSIVPENCARVAAADLLRLLCPPAEVDRVEHVLDDPRLSRLAAGGISELRVLQLAHRLARGCEPELDVAIDRCGSLVGGRDAGETRELMTLVDAVARGRPEATVSSRAETCAALLGELGRLVAGDGAAAHAAVADGRWGGAAPSDAATLAHEMRAHAAPSPESSSSRLSRK